MALKFAKHNKLLNQIVDFYLPNHKCMPEVCPGATELCSKYCYGNCVFRHSEDPDKRMLNTERIARENYRISLTDDFVEEMNILIRNTPNINRIRIHSIGDFYSYEYFLKWIDIIKQNQSIQFTAYVKNYNVLEEFMESGQSVPNNFNVLLSIYPDTYDTYESRGGKDYIDGLLAELAEYYSAKYYVVCSREYFYSNIIDRKEELIFCNGGTDMLCKQYDLNKDDFKDLFVPKQGCAECLKCYSDSICGKGSKIYAVLRASSNLANLDTLLRKRANKKKYSILRELYPKEI